MKKLLWFPTVQEIHFGRNPSYLNSLFVGLTVPILRFPEIVIGSFSHTFFKSLYVFLSVLFGTVLLGVSGMVFPRKGK